MNSTVVAILSSIEFWKFSVPLLGAVVAWFVNEWRKRLADQYQRKEANYKELLRSLRGFYYGSENSDALKLEFLNQLNTAWLYCPDEVIKKGYDFLGSIHTKPSGADSEVALGEFVVAIRKDILSRKLVRITKLSAENFKNFGVNKK